MRKFLLMIFVVLLAQFSTFSQVANHLVIAELYGGGGDQGSYWTNDYIVIYNPTTSTINLSTWSVQYAKFNGNVWEGTNLSGSIEPDGYYIIQEGGGVWGVVPLPFIPNVIGNIDLDKNKGKVALVNSQNVLTVSNPLDDPNVIDFIGYGNGTNAFEGSGPAAQLGLTSSLRRKDNNGNNTYGINGNGWDTNDNFNDSYIELDLINNPPLPVELSSFTAKVLKNGGVRLDWRTETEVDNFGFEVERSQMSNVKSQTEWGKIGFVAGSGNSNSPKNYSFVDAKVSSGKISYRLKQLDTDGKFEYSKIIEVDLGSPQKFELSQNYPNPFNPITKIIYSVPAVRTRDRVSVQMRVYDILGNEVAILVNEEKQPGTYKIEFSATGIPSGVYIYKLEADGFIQSKKMILLK